MTKNQSWWVAFGAVLLVIAWFFFLLDILGSNASWSSSPVGQPDSVADSATQRR